MIQRWHEKQEPEVIWQWLHRMCASPPPAVGWWGSPSNTVFIEPPSLHPKQDLDPLSHACTAKPHERQTDAHATGTSITAVCISRIKCILRTESSSCGNQSNKIPGSPWAGVRKFKSRSSELGHIQIDLIFCMPSKLLLALEFSVWFAISEQQSYSVLSYVIQRRRPRLESRELR